MQRTISRALPLVLAAIVILAAAPITCWADSLTGYYFVLPVGHPDTERGIDGVVTGLVNPTLGPNGFPVVSAFGMTDNGASHPITDVNAFNEILWWTPGQDGVTAWKTQVDTLPLNIAPLFPFNNGCNGVCGDGYVAAYWTGVFNLASPGTVTFNLGSDDDAWVFVDGQLQVDNGGIHGFGVAPTTTTQLTGGPHSVSLFFADRHTVQSAIYFSADVEVTATPEPSTLALMGSSVLGLAGVLRRKLVR
jgi:fibro-slime domain-containing protein